MADPKDNESFFRKVVRFVANPATDWADLNTRQEAGGELDLEKSELKAMVERKRRNDFVRKREFDMLRKIRREGLTPEQLAALGSSSRMDDSEPRISDSALRAGGGVKDKIDNIEREMVGDGVFRSTARPAGFFDAPTEPAAPFVRSRSAALGRAPSAAEAEDNERLPTLPPLPDFDSGDEQATPPLPPAPVTAAPRTPAPPPSPVPPSAAPLRLGPAPEVEVEVSEIVHDPDLDEAVIAFANADFVLCEKSLRRLTAAGGLRTRHADTWLVLFDLYRATGQHESFENLAMEYLQQANWSPPQWFSLPQMVADAVAEERPAAMRVTGNVGWVCPATLDLQEVGRLRSLTLQMPLPWVFDWSELRSIEAEAAAQLSVLFRHWGTQVLEMQWIEGERLFSVLAESAPSGVRDADPAFWIARMEALRLASRVTEFDETAIEYCVTYEVSPPSWEPTRCKVRITGSGQSTLSPAISMISEVSTSFMESWGLDDAGSVVQVATVELTGQLVGDISSTLQRLDNQLGTAPVVHVSCARLIRVDFIAAGDLLNWVLAKRAENRTVQFTDAHRLVALFFGAMGINEHAKVLVRKI